MTMIEAAKGYFGLLVAKYNTEIHDIMQPEDGQTHAIGFCVPPEEEESENEE